MSHLNLADNRTPSIPTHACSNCERYIDDENPTKLAPRNARGELFTFTVQAEPKFLLPQMDITVRDGCRECVNENLASLAISWLQSGGASMFEDVIPLLVEDGMGWTMTRTATGYEVRV